MPLFIYDQATSRSFEKKTKKKTRQCLSRVI